MCGIAGFVSLSGPREAGWLGHLGTTMTNALAHRGEGAGRPYISADRTVMLSCVRLGVQDRTAAGDQPMTSPDGRVALVHNGEVYGSRAPAPPAWPRRTDCDTEFVLQQVCRHADPAAALRPLDGMFALAWHDTATGRVVLARDHFGVKPLVYAFTDGGLLFASEAGALLATGLVRPEADVSEYVLRAWIRMDAADDRTWLRGVRALQPAEYLVAEAPRARAHRYWQPEPDDVPVAPEEIRAAFDRAVGQRRVSDVPRAAVLSGGVDSSAILAGLRAADLPVRGYVLRYADGIGGSDDDVTHAREVAARLGTPVTVCELGREAAADLVPVLPARLMRPLLHGAELAMHRLYSQVAADGNVVVYSGHGADELWGYQDGRYFPVVDPAAPSDVHGRHYLTHRLYPDERPVWGRLVRWLARELGVDMAAVTGQVWERTLAEYRALDTLDPVKRGRYHLMRRFLVYVNDMVDATSAGFTLEDRPVFQDVTLAELAFRVPEYLKNWGPPGSHKELLKSALGDLLPDSVRRRRKQGFPAPADPGYRDRLRGLSGELGLPFGLPPLPPSLAAELGVAEWMFLASSTAWLDQLARIQTGPTSGGVMVTESRRDWQWRTMASAAELDPEPATVEPAKAQEWCNFVLWQPGPRPAGCDTVTGTLRREAPPGRTGPTAGRSPWSTANPVGYRIEVSGGGRRLRLKQFLYDWAFPAVDQPCLWGSVTRPVPVGADRLVWLGTDYLGHRAASARLARTTVELSVLDGEFGDDELVALFAGLEPAVPAAVPRILATPFAELSYWARYPVDMVPVPTGVFAFARRGRAHEGDWVPSGEVTAFLAGQGVPVSVGGFRAESAATFGDGAAVRELEVVYASATGAELRFTAQRAGGGRLQFPPRPDKHPATTETARLADGRPLSLGYVSAEFGACDAWWRRPDGYELRLLASAGLSLGRDAFLELAGRLDSALRLAGNASVLG
jgi:asparagine synthase (glutamine-hydrolysing)